MRPRERVETVALLKPIRVGRGPSRRPNIDLFTLLM
jgi:hypothetical protein